MTARVSRAGKRVAAAMVIAMVGMTALVFAAPAASAANTAKFCADNVKLQTKLDNLQQREELQPERLQGRRQRLQVGGEVGAEEGEEGHGHDRLVPLHASVAAARPTTPGRSRALSGKNYGKAIATWSTYVSTNCT